MKSIDLPKLIDDPVGFITEVCNESPLAAESALSVYVDEKGDVAASSVIEEMHPLSLARILEVHDYTKPTLIYSFLSCDKAVDIFNQLPLLWHNVLPTSGQEYDEEIFSQNIMLIQEKATNTLMSILLSMDKIEDRQLFLEKIGSSSGSFDYLLLPFIGDFLGSVYGKYLTSDFDSIYINNTYQEDSLPSIPYEGTPEHLFSLIAHSNLEIARRLHKELFSESSLVYKMHSMYRQAVSRSLDNSLSTGEAEDDLFEDL
ncbi:hypothetical protein [Solidesulfovibrio magneticus]|uniref:Uncharacterized protein n=1 Tax=Solidesulfovibrio magneticus (strain ATCC 700980 / DSM 13731 / RS-1) TaxID=573370 RepID=C4XM61_SOLM1|nr:hypothetical protein [Solidesulfovibrio magneticus]BAH77189.1 hypothetical protein DMR_36980 [Solidesulfovibrio magneticus RS-1]